MADFRQSPGGLKKYFGRAKLDRWGRLLVLNTNNF